MECIFQEQGYLQSVATQATGCCGPKPSVVMRKQDIAKVVYRTDMHTSENLSDNNLLATLAPCVFQFYAILAKTR